ncbi:MAG: DUF2905 domain-containing protein [Salinibacter sp.]
MYLSLDPKTNRHNPMNAESIGRLLLYLGGGLVVLGGVLVVLGRVVDLGSLPGDFSYEGENVRFYVPVGTMLVVSIVLTVLLNVVLRLFR